MLARLYDPTSGNIIIDGYDIGEVSIDSLRTQMAFVTQESYLFHASIKENITFAKWNATDDEIIAHRLSTILKSRQNNCSELWLKTLYTLSCIRRNLVREHNDMQRSRAEKPFLHDCVGGDELVILTHHQGVAVGILEQEPRYLRTVIDLMRNGEPQLFHMFLGTINIRCSKLQRHR